MLSLLILNCSSIDGDSIIFKLVVVAAANLISTSINWREWGILHHFFSTDQMGFSFVFTIVLSPLFTTVRRHVWLSTILSSLPALLVLIKSAWHVQSWYWGVVHQGIVLMYDHCIIVLLSVVVVIVRIAQIKLVIVPPHQLRSLSVKSILDNCKRYLPLLNMHMLWFSWSIRGVFCGYGCSGGLLRRAGMKYTIAVLIFGYQVL